MAQERPLSPEKQLLKLIEKTSVSFADAHMHAFGRLGLSYVSLGAWAARIAYYREFFKKRFKNVDWRELDVKAVNIFLCVVVFILFSYFAYSFFSSQTLLKNIPNLFLSQKNEQGGSVDKSILSSVGKTASPFIEKARERDIFKMGEKKSSVDVPTAQAQEPSSRILGKMEDLRLVGISWSNDPDAMIENTKALSTFFVKVGQSIGELKVQAIFKDKVIFRYGDEEAELR
jgi:hypothetical protein